MSGLGCRGVARRADRGAGVVLGPAVWALRSAPRVAGVVRPAVEELPALSLPVSGVGLGLAVAGAAPRAGRRRRRGVPACGGAAAARPGAPPPPPGGLPAA